MEFLSKEKSSKEILVVACGEDNTISAARSFRKRIKNLRVFEEKQRKGKASAVNVILKNAKGKVIVFIDSDTLPIAGGTSLLAKRVRGNMVAVSGRPRVKIKNWEDSLRGIIWDMHHILLQNYNKKISASFCAIKNGVIKKIPSNVINDDAFIIASLLKRGYEIGYEPRAIAYMNNANNLRMYLERRRRIARGYHQLTEFGFNSSVPVRILVKVLFTYLKTRKNFLDTILVVLLELLANFLAVFDTLVGRTPYIWKR